MGKSSLLNAILKEDKAIVTNTPGTTRDIVEGRVVIGGIILNLIDTAGIRSTNDNIEKIGIDKSLSAIDEADLILLLLNYNEELTDDDKKLLEKTKDKTRIIIVNKNDLQKKIDLSLLDAYLLLSAKNEKDILILEEKIKKVCELDDISKLDPTYLGNARQIGKMTEAKDNLEKALEESLNNAPIDIINISIRNAWKSLGEILGEVSGDDIINDMFSKFCLGK